MIYGDETITYTNNSPQKLDYLWVQLDQNVRKKDSPSLDRDSESVIPYYLPDSFDKEFLKDPLMEDLMLNMLMILIINLWIILLIKR